MAFVAAVAIAADVVVVAVVGGVGVVLVILSVGLPQGVVGRDNGDGVELAVGGTADFVAELPGFEVLLLPFFEHVWCCSFFTVVGDVADDESSSSPSLPLRFLPCRRHGSSGVARTRTSQGNLSIRR